MLAVNSSAGTRLLRKHSTAYNGNKNHNGLFSFVFCHGLDYLRSTFLGKTKQIFPSFVYFIFPPLVLFWTGTMNTCVVVFPALGSLFPWYASSVIYVLSEEGHILHNWSDLTMPYQSSATSIPFFFRCLCVLVYVCLHICIWAYIWASACIHVCTHMCMQMPVEA